MLKATLKGALIALVCSMSVCAYAMADIPTRIDIPAGDLNTALQLLVKKTGIELVFNPEQLAGLRTKGVTGTFSSEQAARKLLEGTKLELRTDRATGAMMIGAPVSAGQGASTKSTTGRDPPTSKDNSELSHLAQVTQEIPEQPPSVEKTDTADKHNKSRPFYLEEVVVTGTHIRGAKDSATPVYSYSREDIDRTGVGTVAEFMATIPQNFGSASESTAGTQTGGGDLANVVGGTGVNLRGLGADSTLTLVNGHRVAPGNLTGNFVDVSLIPLSAVERIDVLPYGASAIYGSDAVGGVVNIILRQNFEGSESDVRYGSVAGSDSHETTASQTSGHVWNNGSGLLTYEYYDRTPLSSSDRSYTDSTPQPEDLLGEQVRHSIFGTLEQSLGQNVSLFADGNFTHKNNVYNESEGSALLYFVSQIESYGGTIGTRISISPATEVELSSTYSSSDTKWQQQQVGESTATYDSDIGSSIFSLDAKADGEIGWLADHYIGYAVGGQFRTEDLDEKSLYGAPEFNPTRHIGAVFAELRIPIIRSPGPHYDRSLELTLADREEHYSDFGLTNDPQLGLIWKANTELQLAGSYGHSFKAPLLDNLNPTPLAVEDFPSFDPQSSGARTGATSCNYFAPTDACTNTLLVYGGNPNLRPETAKTWTLGMNFRSSALPGLKAHATYYDTRFSNLITNPTGTVNVFDGLLQENLLGPSIIQRNPALSEVQSIVNSATALNVWYPYAVGPMPLSSIGAIYNAVYVNLSSLHTAGIDFGVSYRKAIDQITIMSGMDGVYISKFNSQFSAGTSVQSLLNTTYNPVRLKIRASEEFEYRGLTGAAFINYENSYTNNSVVPAVPISSWTTVDLSLSWKLQLIPRSSYMTMVALSAINVANRNPPFVKNVSFPINYDGANANALGRVLSLELSQRW